MRTREAPVPVTPVPDASGPGRGAAARDAPAALACEGLEKRFDALRVARGISLELRAGEIHALIGPNGAGKSTLVALLAGSLRPDAGRVHLAGRDVTALDAPARARLGLGRTFQVSALAGEHTALQNALLGAIGARGRARPGRRAALADAGLRATAEAALARVGIGARAAVPAAELSHGERRRLEIAVALARAPAALLMDEPMAGLGAEGAAELGTLLVALREEAPILMIEHDMDAVFRLADRVSVLVDGALLATGTGEEIRRDAAVRRAYLGDGA